jgi:hypothetical protein
MHGELAGRTVRAAPDRRRSSLEWNGDSRLRTLLLEDAASDEAGVEVSVTRACGAVDVRVAGPAAALTLRFDRAEAYPDAVRCAMRAAIAKYRSALGLEARGSDQE